MKPLLLMICIVCANYTNAQTVDQKHIQKATVSKTDSIISLTANIRLDHRIFGYGKPDTNSKKLLLFSVFTSDVEGNPYKCTYGSFYQTSGMKDITIKYQGLEKNFIRACIIKNDSAIDAIYILKTWIKFEK